jgi:tetratricopeptide (TPR) repeat protein
MAHHTSRKRKADHTTATDVSPPDGTEAGGEEAAISQEAFEQEFRDIFAENQTDAQARAILQEFREAGEPFALYLRNFEAEAYDVPKPATELDPEERLFAYMGGLSSVEEKLAAAFTDKVTVVAVANPSDLLMSAPRFPRLELPNEDWIGVVEWLVQAASFIVFDLDSLAEGVSIELDVIAKHGRQEATVVVLPSAQPAHSMKLEQELLRTMGGQLPAHQQVDRRDSKLGGFRRIAGEDEIDFEDLSSSPLFWDLLAEYERQMQGEEDVESLRHRAHLVDAWGIRQLANEDAEALNSFATALGLFVEAEDPMGTAAVLMNIGRAYLDVGQYEDAMQAFRDSGSISKKYGDETGFRRAAVWVALAYYLARDLTTASEYLLGVLEMEREAGETEVLVDALDLLCRIYRESGDRDSARRCAEDLKAARHAAGQRQTAGPKP